MKNVLRTIKDQDTLELDDIIKGLEAEEKLAPAPMRRESRAFKLYDIVNRHRSYSYLKRHMETNTR